MGDAQNVTVFGDIADKYDALVATDEKLLDNWVESEGYSTSSMVIASTAMAFMTFAKGFVDVGRIGNGIIVEGGIKGVGKDVLRALNLAGGAGAVVGRGAKLLRLVQGTDTCVWFTHANAVRLAGQRFFLSAADLARRAGLSLPQITQAGGTTAAEFNQMVAALRAMGVPIRQLGTGLGRSISNVLDLVKGNPGGVVTFGIRHGGGFHRLYATWSRLGGLVIRDPASRFATYRSLADLAKVYGQGVGVSEFPIMFIPNAVVTTAAEIAQTVGGGSLLSSVLLQVLPAITMSASDSETATQALMVHEQVAAGGAAKQAPPQGQRQTAAASGGTYHTVVSGDWLSKLAKHYYGNMHKWPVIYAANTRTIGRNPDLIKPGQKLLIPDLPNARIIAAAAVPGYAVVAV